MNDFVANVPHTLCLCLGLVWTGFNVLMVMLGSSAGEGPYLSLSPVSTGGRQTSGATVRLSCEAILDCDGPSAGGENVLDFDCFSLFSPSL